MGTQGFDHEVARGGLKTIKRVYGLQSELSIISIYNNMLTYVNSITLFRELGFEIAGIYQNSRDNQTLQLIEANCIFKKKLTLTD